MGFILDFHNEKEFRMRSNRESASTEYWAVGVDSSQGPLHLTQVFLDDKEIKPHYVDYDKKRSQVVLRFFVEKTSDDGYILKTIYNNKTMCVGRANDLQNLQSGNNVEPGYAFDYLLLQECDDRAVEWKASCKSSPDERAD